MWQSWNTKREVSITDVKDLPLQDFWNLLANQRPVVLVDTRVDGGPGLRFSSILGDFEADEEAAMARVQDAVYRAHAIIVVGGGAADARVAKAMEWLRTRKWQHTHEMAPLYRLLASAQDLLNTFSFLDESSSLTPQMRREREEYALPHRIMDDLYLGDYDAARNPILATMNIRYIVNASGGFENFFEHDESFKYHVVNVHDSEDAAIQEYFASTVKFIDEARANNVKVLVHCAAGISRSTTLLLVYLMTREQMTLRDAFLHTKRRREIVCPNSGFVLKLLEYEKNLRGINSVTLPVSAASPTSRYRSYFTLQELIRNDMEMAGKVDPEVRAVLDY